MMYYCILLCCFITACGTPKNKTQPPADDPRVAELREKDAATKAEALALRDPDTGWLVTGGDGMLWTGKYAAVTGVQGVHVYAAEKEPGRFGRDPDGEESVNPNWSDWARDAATGLTAFIWRKGLVTMLERHIAYGVAHMALANNVPIWRMGEPVGDGRGLYPPAFIGRLYQTLYALNGTDNENRLWPDIYARGLVDFQAHLQVMNIWHRGEVEEALRLKNAPMETNTTDTTDDAAGPSMPLVLDVTDSQLQILKEQAARDARDPFFQAVLGVYTGDMGPAIDALLAADGYVGEYVRCDGNQRTCEIAAWLFAADIVLRRYED